MGNIEITTKFSRSKSVSGIDNGYLETATEISQYLQENNCVGVLFNKVANLQVY